MRMRFFHVHAVIRCEREGLRERTESRRRFGEDDVDGEEGVN